MPDEPDKKQPLQGVIVPRNKGPVTEFNRERPRTGYGSRGPYKFDDIKRHAYVHLIRQGIRRVRASEIVGVSYHTIIRYMEADEDFRMMVHEAEMARVDEVEEALFREAIAGGNVTAQQVILYNRRSDEWADQRQLKARIEAAQAEAAEQSRAADASSLDGLRDKLMSLRERVTPATAPETESSNEEQQPVTEAS